MEQLFPSHLWLRCRESLRRDGDEDGQGLVEYAFILVLIVLVCIVIFTVVSKQTNNLYSNIQSGMGA